MAPPLSKVTQSKELTAPKPGKARKKPPRREFNHPGILPVQSVGKCGTGTWLAPDVAQLSVLVRSSVFLKSIFSARTGKIQSRSQADTLCPLRNIPAPKNLWGVELQE